MRFKMFYKKTKIIEALQTSEGVLEFLRTNSKKFSLDESLDSNQILPIVNDGTKLSLLVFTSKNIYKIYCEDDVVINWTLSIPDAKAIKAAKINPIKVKSGPIFDLYIFPFVGERRYKVQRSLFVKKSFIDAYSEMLD